MLNNKNFYPTPQNLIIRMLAKVKNKHPHYILEPSAGKGDIIKAIEEGYQLGYGRRSIKAIELDNDLYATLRGKNIDVIERDFLSYNGGDIFDLIVMNPPFEQGEKHLLKAIDILYSGEIVCLLNAETIKNPYCASRKELIKKLDELEAEIEYIPDAFLDAERETSVEVALIYIHIVRDIETDLLANAEDTTTDEAVNFQDKAEANIALNDVIGALETHYKATKEKAKKAILDFYSKNCHRSVVLKVGSHSSDESRPKIEIIQDQINTFNEDLRDTYWQKALDLPSVRRKMTAANRERFWAELKSRANLEFTANNVRDFIISLIGSYEQTLIDACVELFDDFTQKYSYWSECDKNKLHFSTWKTNEAFKVNKKVIKPMYSNYGGYAEAFLSYGTWKLGWGIEEILHDIDKVLNYIAGTVNYRSTAEAIKRQMQLLNSGHSNSTTTDSTFFSKISFYKKGTLHLTFRDESLLRRFNIIACKGKGWLPDDYGTKEYRQYSQQDKDIVDSFEGAEAYKKYLHDKPTFSQNSQILRIAA